MKNNLLSNIIQGFSYYGITFVFSPNKMLQYFLHLKQGLNFEKCELYHSRITRTVLGAP